jgi:hypothetical protein
MGPQQKVHGYKSSCEGVKSSQLLKSIGVDIFGGPRTRHIFAAKLPERDLGLQPEPLALKTAETFHRVAESSKTSRNCQKVGFQVHAERH